VPTVPRYVRFVTEWPMSSTKVQTFRLREQLEAELACGLARFSSGGDADPGYHGLRYSSR
jgi:hypothetical protein